MEGEFHMRDEGGKVKAEGKALTDTDRMPWGKYKGELMQDVAASYFHWLWTNGKKDDRQCPVANYIRASMSALQQEHPDGVWE